MLIFAQRLLLDALAGAEIIVAPDALTLVLPRTLRRPIKLDRGAVAGVIVDTAARANADERLRFPVGGVSDYLYSSIMGSALPLLSAERVVPNLAIVFERPLAFSEPRHRFANYSDFAPLRPLQPSSPVPGVLLSAVDPESASSRLAAWNDPERVQAALRGTLPVAYRGVRPDRINTPALRQPLRGDKARRLILQGAWAPVLGALFAAARIADASRASLGLGGGLALALGMGLLFGGGVLDMRLRYQERGGLARVASVGIAGTGLMIAFAVLAVNAAHT